MVPTVSQIYWYLIPFWEKKNPDTKYPDNWGPDNQGLSVQCNRLETKLCHSCYMGKSIKKQYCDILIKWRDKSMK